MFCFKRRRRLRRCRRRRRCRLFDTRERERETNWKIGPYTTRSMGIEKLQRRGLETNI